jgi:hypothetical protein
VLGLSGLYTGTNNAATVTIIDEADRQSGKVQFENDEVGITENEGTAEMSLVRTGGSDGNLIVGYVVKVDQSTADKDKDYYLEDGLITFEQGETQKSILVSLIDDHFQERDEELVVELNYIEGGGIGTPSTAKLLIHDDDGSQGSLEFTKGAYSANEADGSFVVTVTRNGSSTGEVSVKYSVTGGDAIENVDYTQLAGVLNFKEGETSKTIEVALLDDDEQEEAESIVLTLSEPGNSAVLGIQASTTITIVDNDNADSLSSGDENNQAITPGVKIANRGGGGAANVVVLLIGYILYMFTAIVRFRGRV